MKSMEWDNHTTLYQITQYWTADNSMNTDQDRLQRHISVSTDGLTSYKEMDRVAQLAYWQMDRMIKLKPSINTELSPLD
jgi:hypothetical protein